MLFHDIRKFLKRTGMKPTRLGRNALNDSRSIRDFQNNTRTPRPATCEKLRNYMTKYLLDNGLQ